MDSQPKKYFLKDDGIFPNNPLPVLHYEKILQLPFFFPAGYIKEIFKTNRWTNSWKGGIYTSHHYHSITHEVLGIYKGKTILQLGGENGIKIIIEKGDVIIIPAGVSHKNLKKEKDVLCVGAYPAGRVYDMNYGKVGERPQTDKNIAFVPVPLTDPILGPGEGLAKIWEQKYYV